MILNKVSLKNYRQYRDMELEFSKDPKRNFTIIKGNNGTGKTTLLNALSWCLYGKEIHDYGDDSSMLLCNNKAANLANVGDVLEVSVTMEFEEDGDILEFSRFQKYTKTFDGLNRDIFGPDFQVRIHKDGKSSVEMNNYYLRDKKIPKKVEDYFFFDGARLSEYFQDTSSRKIKEAVFELSQLNLVSNIGKNIPKVKKSYNDKLKKINPQLGKSNAQIQKFTSRIKNNEEEIEGLEKIIKSSEKGINDIRKQQNSFNSEKVKSDVKRDQQLEKEIESITKKSNNLENQRKDLILTNYPFILSYYSFNNFLSYGDVAREKKYIPADFKLSFLKDLLEDGKCICGADLTKDDAHRKAIEDLIANTSPITNKSEEISSILTKIEENILKNIRSFKSKIYNLNVQISELNQELEVKTEERNRIGANLLANPIEEIKRLERERKDLEKQKSEAENKKGRLEVEIETAKKELGKWNQQKAKEDGLEVEAREYDTKINFCNDVEKMANYTVKTLTNQMRDKIQNLTKEKFLKIIWKEDEFVDIRINDFYEVFIKNKLGQEERPGDLSDGEKLCLGLCFMSALHNISGFDLPIIMDTPLGNLDVDMRHNIAQFLPDFVGGKQTVLLVTGTEYTEDFRDTLSSSVGREYVIDWNNSEDGKESKVVLVNG